MPSFFQFFFSYLDKGYAAFMAGKELDELGEYDNEFVQNISKFAEFESKQYACCFMCQASLMQEHIVLLSFQVCVLLLLSSICYSRSLFSCFTLFFFFPRVKKCCYA